MSRKPPMRVLLVEDNPGDARLVELYLRESRRWPFDVQTAGTFRDAARMAEEESGPDAVLLDLSLPDGEGLDLFRRAQETFDAPLVLVTGREDDDLVEALASEGAQDYLVKGRFDSDVLGRAVVSARERHDLLLALRTRERELGTILANTPDIVARFDREGRCLYVNEALERSLSIPRGFVIGKTPVEMGVPPDHVETFTGILESVFEERKTRQLEQKVETSLGSRWFQGRFVPEEDAGGEVTTVLTTSRDVTRRVRAQRELEATAAELEERIKETECLYGVSRVLYDAETVEEVTPAVVGLLPTGFQYPEIASARVEVEGAGSRSDGFVESPWRLRQSLSADGEEIGFVEVSYSEERPERDEGPFLLEERMLLGAVAERIEDAVRRERARLAMDETQSRLRQARTLEAMGHLAGGVAHDFNNLLTAIAGYTELLLMRAEDDETRSDLEEIRGAAMKAGHLTGQLLAFGRRQVLQPRILDLGEIVREMRRMLSRVVGEDVDMVMELPADSIRIEADRGQIEEALVGLGAFVRGHHREGGTMTVRVDEVMENGDREARLVISDDGQGLDDEAKERLFEPFFTSRELGFGWGLGLASVYGIVDQSGGWIDVASTPGQGTTFEIRFPKADGARVAGEEIGRGPCVEPLTGKKILVIEDDRAVRNLVARTLGSRGYQVETAENGKQGLQRATVLRRELALVITDVVMPQVRGPELARKIVGVAGDVPVLFMSGYAEQALDPEVVRGARDFLQKPFTARDLLARVERLLAARPSSKGAS